MKNKLHLLTITALAAALVAPLSANAKPKKADAGAAASPAASVAAASPAKEKGDRPIPYNGNVSTVDAAAKTFSIASKEGKERTFKVTDKSVVTKGGKPATFADIVKGEEIRGSYWKKADGSMETKSVKVGPLTAEEQAAKEAKQARKAAKKAGAAASPTAKP